MTHAQPHFWPPSSAALGRKTEPVDPPAGPADPSAGPGPAQEGPAVRPLPEPDDTSTGGEPAVGGTMLGRYRIVRRLGQGGMGVVYLGRAEGAAGFVRPVVIKCMLPHLMRQEHAEMFVREARVLSNLQHPGIVSVLDFGLHDGGYAMVLDYVRGYDLRRWLRYRKRTGGCFPAVVAIQIAIEVLRALDYAHTRRGPDGKPLGIVHRDVSPSNVLVDAEGRVKLADFGIARMSGDASVYLTQQISVKGKPIYIAPELLWGEAPGPSSDTYSVGVMLHELLVGRNEFHDGDPGEVYRRVRRHVPSSVEALRGDVPTGIDAILQQALAKSPRRRYRTAAELAKALVSIRHTTEEQALAEVTSHARQDFLGPLPACLGMPSLEEVDRHWREAREPRPETPTRPLRWGSEPLAALRTRPIGLPPLPGHRQTQALSSAPSAVPPSAAPARRPRLRRARAPALAGVLLLAGASAMALPGSPWSDGSIVGQPTKQTAPSGTSAPVTDSTRSEERREGTTPDGDGEPTEKKAVEAGAAPPAGKANAESQLEDAEHLEDAEDAESTEPARRRRRNRVTPAQKAGALSRTFARHRRRVEACFRRHAPEHRGRLDLAVRFRIDRPGHVQQATLIPEGVGATAAGRCVRAIARDVRFPAGIGPAVFRIPIAVGGSS